MTKKTIAGYTFQQMLDCHTGVGADRMVRNLLSHTTEVQVRPVGDNGDNSGNIMLASDPIKAMTEIFGSNTADALAVKYVRRYKDYNCTSPREVVAKRTGIPEGRFDSLSKRNRLVKNILGDVKVTLRGEVTPKNATVDVRDLGVGVEPQNVPATLCGLGGGGKTFTLWQSGAFGQGGKAPLAYANKEGQVCQFIATRFYDSDEVTFTFIYRDMRHNIARTPIWYYLVDASTGKPWTIKADELEVPFEPGTLIRTFDYQLGVQGADKFNASTGSLKDMVRRTLPDPLTPIVFEDRRTPTATDRRWLNYLKGSNSTFTHMGSLYDLRQDPQVNFRKKYQLELDMHSSATLEVFVFNPECDCDHIHKYVSEQNPFTLVLNGQTHGSLPKHLLTRDAGYTALNKRFFALVDLDELSTAAKINLFSSTREHLTDSDELSQLKRSVLKTLLADDDLADLNLAYRDFNSTRTDGTEETLVNQLVNQYIFSKQNSPHAGGSRKAQGEGTSSTTPSTPRVDIPISANPSLFELQGSPKRKVTKGKTFNVKVRTDVHPKYFRNAETFMVDCPYSYISLESMSRNDGGYKTFTFSVSGKAPSDVEASIFFEVAPPGVEPMSFDLQVQVQDRKPKEAGDSGLPFDIQNVETLEFLEALEMSEQDVSVLKVEGGDNVIYINLLNPLFQDQIEAYNSDGRLKDPSDIVTRYRALYKGEAIVTAWEAFRENDEDQDYDLLERVIRQGTRSSFNTLRRTVTTAEDLRKLTGSVQ